MLKVSNPGQNRSTPPGCPIGDRKRLIGRTATDRDIERQPRFEMLANSLLYRVPDVRFARTLPIKIV